MSPAGFTGIDDDGVAYVFGLQVGSEGAAGTKFDRIRKVTVAVDPASLAANTSAETAVAIAGVAAGDLVFCNVPAALEVGLAFSGIRVSAADTVQLRLSNVTVGAIDGISRNWDFFVLELG